MDERLQKLEEEMQALKLEMQEQRKTLKPAIEVLNDLAGFARTTKRVGNFIKWAGGLAVAVYTLFHFGGNKP